jgi:DNA-binding GntR family transcriptional regulator
MEGFIDIYPEKGAVINIISIQDVQQIYDIIGVLEGFSTELVTMSIKASDNKKLRSLHKDLKKVGQRKNYKEWLEINSLFHGYFPQMSGNPHLINIINLLRRRIYRYRFIAITIPGHIEEYIRAHEEILEAISKKNAKGAGRAMVQHVFHVKEVLVNFLKQYPGL